MEKLIYYFNNAPDYHRVILLLASMLIFGGIEVFRSISNNYNKLKQFKLNATFMLTAAPVQVVFGLGIIYLLNLVAQNNWGILNLLELKSSLTYFVVSFVLLDFFEYVYHVIMHKVYKLWSFHLVHHTDNVVNVSTTLREHPMETAIRLTFLLVWVAISGITFWALIMRQFIQIVFNVFAHANVRLPYLTNKIIAYVFVTPNIHHVHHHTILPYTDTNYGDVLSIWDRFFGTFSELHETKTIFGIDTHTQINENSSFVNLVQTPFIPYTKTTLLAPKLSK